MANQDMMKVFKSAEFKQMRVAIHGDEPFFCGRDILENLDYTETQIAIITKIFADVPQGMKSRHKLMTPGGVKDLLCLSESGARWFLGRSDKPKSFKLLMWVMADILPMIHNGEAQINSDTAVESVQLGAYTQRIVKITPENFNKLKDAVDKFYGKLSINDLLVVVGAVSETKISKQTLYHIRDAKNFDEYKEITKSQWKKYRPVSPETQEPAEQPKPTVTMKEMYTTVAIKQEIASTREELKEIRALLKSLIDSLT